MTTNSNFRVKNGIEVGAAGIKFDDDSLQLSAPFLEKTRTDISTATTGSFVLVLDSNTDAVNSGTNAIAGLPAFYDRTNNRWAYIYSNIAVTTATTPSGGDPYWDDVYIYLDGETLTDTSSFARTVTNSGVSTSTTQVKYGARSLYFNGSSRLSLSGSDLGADTGDFTLDLWAYVTSVPDYGYFVETREDGATAGAMLFTTDSGGGIGSYVDTGYWLFENQGSLSLNTWNHIALSRSGSTTKAFINGTQVASVTDAINYNKDGFSLGGNYNGSGGFFNGYMDNIRWTKGVARYTSSFTPPTAGEYGP